MNEDTNVTDKLRAKDTRWDRIRKRHMNSLTVKTETVKKIFAIDFIGKHQIKALTEDATQKKILDPSLVMDLRHEMIRSKNSRRRGVALKEIALENTKSHNKLVEEHYIESELKKFRREMEKSRRKISLRPKITMNLNNNAIFDSLEKCNKHTIDFYKTVENALQHSQEFNKIASPVHIQSARESLESNLSNKIAENNVGNYQIKNENPNDKSVRFRESVDIINYSPQDDIRNECGSSNNSSDVDSVASDIVDDVFHEVRMEAEMEMIGKSLDTLQKSPYEAIKHIEVPERPLSPALPIEKETPKINGDLTTFLNVKKILPIEIKVPCTDVIGDEDDSTTSKSSDTASREQIAIISELFISKVHNSEILLRKYFLRWTHATTISKIEKMNLNNKNDRFQKINSFLDKIRFEKRQNPKQKVNPRVDAKENSVVLAKKYQNKIKIQQDIIDLQKVKLERQERLIMELKLNKLLDQHKQSREDTKQELKAVMKTGDIKNRTKAKYLQLAGNLRDQEDEDEFARLQGKALMMPQFLVNMQERAMERNVKHEQAKQRRLQMEAEREAAKVAIEEAKRLEDEEAKQKRIEALKEKRRLEKLNKLEKERARLRAIENNKKCQEFRRRWLLRWIGMEAFKRLIKRKRKLHRKAEAYRKLLMSRKIFHAWKVHVQSVWEHKNKMADEQYTKIVQAFAFKAWIAYHHNERSKYLVAVDWYDLKITEAVLQQWVGLMKLHKLIEDAKSVQAISHYEWNLRWKVIDHWRRLPQVLKIEKATEERRQRWRMKIWELLPDYQPNKDK